MENLIKYSWGGLAALLGVLAPIRPLVVCAMCFIAIDFVTGVIASHKRAAKAGVAWGFESDKAWNTVSKTAFVMAGIVLAFLIDEFILKFMELRLANIFTGFVCGVEFWSYLENASEISEHPVFRMVKKVMKEKIEEKIDPGKNSGADV